MLLNLIPILKVLLTGARLREIYQLGRVLLKLLPDALSALRALEERHGKLTPARRAEVAAELREGIRQAVETKDTSRLEALFAPPAERP